MKTVSEILWCLVWQCVKTWQHVSIAWQHVVFRHKCKFKCTWTSHKRTFICKQMQEKKRGLTFTCGWLEILENSQIERIDINALPAQSLHTNLSQIKALDTSLRPCASLADRSSAAQWLWLNCSTTDSESPWSSSNMPFIAGDHRPADTAPARLGVRPGQPDYPHFVLACAVETHMNLQEKRRGQRPAVQTLCERAWSKWTWTSQKSMYKQFHARIYSKKCLSLI